MADTPITVTRAVPTLRTPDTTSILDRAITVTAAALQPASSAIAFALVMGLTGVAIEPAPKAVALNWQQSGSNWVIDVNSANFSFQPYPVEGRRGIPVGHATPTISPQVVNLAYRQVFVEPGLPTFVGQDLILEENAFFVRAAPTLTPSNIGLSRGIPVTSAALTFSPQTITLTPSTSGVFAFDSAAPTLAPQDIGLNLVFSVAPVAAEFAFTPQNIALQHQINNGVTIAEAHPVFTPSNIVLAHHMPVTEAVLSFAGQEIGFRYDWILPVDSLGPNLDDGFGPFGQEIGITFPFTLGLTTELLNVTFVGQDISLYLGSGEPTEVKVFQTSPSIQISLGAPITVATTNSENIQSG
jgi:hypothetical protein